MPFSAPLPVPTMIATGVAKPNAHGQLITKIEIAIENANSTVAPIISQLAPAAIAIAITAGTNTPAILSASFAIGAFDAEASSTNAMILLIVVSSPTASARKCNKPSTLRVPLVNRSPSDFDAGIDSPVIADSSTLDSPLVITPSTAINSPGRTTSSSPTITSAASISISEPSRMTTAFFGESFSSFSTAAEVLPFARASRYLPTVISVTIIPADSKYKLRLYSSAIDNSPCPSP